MRSNDERLEFVPGEWKENASARSGAQPGPALGLHSKPGRSGVTVRSIVNTAIELADAEGLERVSMRQVAERLKVGTMSLYTHVPGKGELTDLMFDTVFRELYADADEPSRQPGGWRGAWSSSRGATGTC